MPLVEPHGPDQPPHAPPPSLWPVGFAIGIAILLTGVVIEWIVVALGAGIAVVFGYLWVREVMGGAPAPPAVAAEEPALPLADEGELERFPRSKFLEGATLGLGGVIGGLVTVPAVGLAVLPTFIGQEQNEVDVGPLEDFPEGEWRIVTYMEDPEEGEVTRRTAYVRYNGLLDGQPSMTILSNRCAHLGCPVQPSGPVADDEAKTVKTSNSTVTRIPTNPAAFACPCHGGAYNTEGNRTAGPPVRALDRYAYAIRNGRLFLIDTYSVGEVRGEGKEAVIVKYDLANPGIHVDGPEQVLYPIESPR
jgi:menaquinol-cytochrome c reductase iron-sulfur subunit